MQQFQVIQSLVELNPRKLIEQLKRFASNCFSLEVVALAILIATLLLLAMFERLFVISRDRGRRPAHEIELVT